MIKQSFIKKQIEISNRKKKTSPFLKRLIFSVVDKALKKHYGDSYAVKCLQSSVAIHTILEKYEIRAQELVGALCVSQVFEDDIRPPNWNGFWGDDHHVWLSTEYGEIVDLTINALHLHPMSIGNSQLPVPAVWWGDIGFLPKILRYLPDGAVKLTLPEDEEDLEKFKYIVVAEYESTLNSMSINDIEYEPILCGMESLNGLYISGNSWLQKSLILQEAKVPYPRWIEERERHLLDEYANKQKSK